MKYWAGCIAVVILLVSTTLGHAQEDFPSRNVRLLFGFSAGTDVGARIVADALAERLGKPVTVENVTGAAGNIAADRTAHAVPDGYTVGMLTGANIILRPLLNSTVPYAPLERLTPISLAYRFPNLLVVSSKSSPATLKDLVEMARTKPAGLTFGHLGNGSVTHLSAELLKMQAGIDIRGVAYRGAPALLSDITGGHVDMAFLPPSSTMPLVRSGTIRALVSTSRTREPFAPDVPTVAEAGYPDIETTVWFGLFVPSGAPPEAIRRLGDAVRSVMERPEVRTRLIEVGLVPVGSTQSEFEQVLAQEQDFWSKLIKDAGLRPVE